MYPIGWRHGNTATRAASLHFRAGMHSSLPVDRHPDLAYVGGG